MSFRNPFPRAFLICLASVALSLAGVAAAQDCVSFQDIEHCPVGDVTLEVSADGLTVNNHGDGGGVSSRFAPTVFWKGRVAFPQESQSTQLASISGGETTRRTRLLIEPAEGGAYRLRAVFTGDSVVPTYSVLVYLDGVLQGSLGNFDGREPGDGARMTFSGDGIGAHAFQKRPPGVYQDVTFPPEPFLPWWWPWVDIDFRVGAAGGCNWVVGTAEVLSFDLPDGQSIKGNEIRFTEDLFGPGHYPYLGFESIEIVSSVSSFAITDELADSAR